MLTKNAEQVLKSRYLHPGEKPKDLFMRVAKNIARADKKYKTYSKKIEEEFLEMMLNLDFLPNSPTLFNAGKPLQQLSACFALPVEDNIEGIFETLKLAALIHKTGGGTGFSFSHIRPKGDLVKTTHRKASGPISFIKVFDCATEQIKLGGMRRGANMGVLRIDHPDIEDFIHAKEHIELRNFNLSVGLTDAFMKAVKKNKYYNLINPRTKKAVAKKNARKIFHSLCKAAHKCGDPGVIFLDTINRKNPTPKLGAIEATNPCGEVPLLPYEACNLGSINLANFVKDGKVDYDLLRDTIRKAVHFLDNVIGMSNYPSDKIKNMVQGNRKIGLGVMGFADMLVQLGISYASENGVKTAEKVMKFISTEAKKASAALAKTRGVFPNFKGSIYNTGKSEDRVRNSTRTSIAPTGTISLIANCSSSIEPLFGLAITRHILGKKITEINPHAKALLKNHPAALKKMIRKGTVESTSLPPELKKILLVAHQIKPEWHIKMQAAFQKYTDNAVSKTVNLKMSATVKDIEKIFMCAHESGCKGISVYRYESKRHHPLVLGCCS